jgi:hypothetical protein
MVTWITLYSSHMSIRPSDNKIARMLVEMLAIAYRHRIKIWYKFQLQNEAEMITIRKLNV